MTERKSILIIGMVDSVHLANWLLRFQDENIDFQILPSHNFRRVHPSIAKLTKKQNRANYSIIGNSRPFFGTGYWDYIRAKVQKNYRAISLKRQLRNNDYEFIHAIEIQHAGYLLLAIESKLLRKSMILLTNWGSDIYYFAQLLDHKYKIEKLLSMVDAYSAECLRDYKLARHLGFSGRELPLVPNSFNGVDESTLLSPVKTSERKQIIVKGYGGKFGLAGLVVTALEIVLAKWIEYKVIFYSVTEDTKKPIENLKTMYPQRVQYFTINQKLSPAEMLNLFLASRIYIGCSQSDGISTSFLESMAAGAYPIQTNTSCVDEWVGNGAIATAVNPTLEELIPAIESALENDGLVNRAQENNLKVLKKLANLDNIATKSREFYFWE
jgi:glycosyltransferase involved in cell wall biosynthesis